MAKVETYTKEARFEDEQKAMIAKYREISGGWSQVRKYKFELIGDDEDVAILREIDQNCDDDEINASELGSRRTVVEEILTETDVNVVKDQFGELLGLLDINVPDGDGDEE